MDARRETDRVGAHAAVVDWAAFEKARAELGVSFVRILGYFHEDGTKSVAALEEATRAQNAAAMVIPAHTLKGEARQFGAKALADLAEEIEVMARACVERRDPPTEAVEPVVRIRELFEETMNLLAREANPLVARKPAGFGRRVA